jgi:hypothetical protein
MTPDHELGNGVPDPETNVSSIDWGTYESAATAVAEAVATATGRDQTDLDPLQYTVDADALDRLFDDAGADELVVSFTYEGVQVRVTQNVVEVWQ